MASSYCIGLSTLVSVNCRWGGSEEWAKQQHMAWTRSVPRAECQLYETRVTATWRGVPVRVVEVRNWVATVRMIGSDLAQAQVIGASMVDQGVFENAEVPAKELLDMQAVSNEIVAAPKPGDGS